MVVLDIEDVGADHAAVEQGRKVEVEGDDIAVLEVFTADDEGGHREEDQADAGADGGDQDGDAVGADDIAGYAEDEFVGFQGGILRQEAEAV